VKDVHKVPALDLVGWYTILPTSGPQPIHLPIHRQILHSYNESAILLGFHPAAVLEGSVGGKLPLTIYESNYEADDITTSGGEDREMKDGEPQLALKFKELPYSVETGEAEMISVDFVARGGGNATAVDGTVKSTLEKGEAVSKGKTRASKKEEKEAETSKTDDQHILSREDEELIASLTAKANAIKMLHARINLITLYLQNLPPSYISNVVPEGVESNEKKYTPVNHAILRSIQALLSRLSLLIPADAAAFEHELMSEQNDVNLVSLLSTITQSIK
jgi:COP9 signalosome complex subunit 6